MRCELPVLLRCCFCFPLRYGLLVWAYIKQILNLLLTINVIFQLSKGSRRVGTFGYVFLSIVLVSAIIDAVFNGLFIISAHRKDYRKMRIFYRYNIAFLCVHGVFIVLFISNLFYHMHLFPHMSFYIWYDVMPLLITYLMILLCQGYLILLVRSEFMKLKMNSQFEFVNNAAEEKCTANIDFDKGIPV